MSLIDDLDIKGKNFMDKHNTIIFDLDGTLWDATGCSSDIWNRVFEKYEEVNIRMTKQISEGLMGKTMEEIGDELFPELPVDRRRAITDEFGVEEVKYLSENGAILYSGMKDTVSNLAKKYNLYIVSNCQDGYVPAFFKAHDMESYFKDIEMSGRTGKDKGQNIKLIMERNGIENAIYVGDTAGDEKAARDAGIPFVWAAYGFGEAENPDAVINDITALPDLLNEIYA
ncbi:phosphoglycolate phosphatase [Pseudobutyrivibrio sp. YE44]|uniref:HAD family hydrolase n=1 Tax=Pseudobutyrivibrio sp. YE44 TaxID=1520802 RepID=UPI0008823187|nr:HAD family hydrolase [Pseudobutyrivibrio sp. YE44]SDB56542.1 phosphoglycolate phosphatase [Pseudobutyrivibrio sp. YE44]